MAKVVIKKDGEKVVLLNPAEKSKRYARQLKHGIIAETGEALSNTQKAWRSGYLKARKDNAKAFKAKQKKLFK